MPKIDIASIPVDTRTGYPPPLDRIVQGRERKRLGNAVGLDQFGVNLTALKPGAGSALRHWHEKEDELVYVLHGEVVLVEDGTDRDAIYLEIGTRSKHETARYPDVDLVAVRDDKGMRYTHKNGEPYK
jgi:uncharacterized cupin superfamily protein